MQPDLPPVPAADELEREAEAEIDRTSPGLAGDARRTAVVLLTVELGRRYADRFTAAHAAESEDADRQVRYFGWQRRLAGLFVALLVVALVTLVLGFWNAAVLASVVALGAFGAGCAALQLIWPGPTRVAPETGRSRAEAIGFIWLTGVAFGSLLVKYLL